MIYKLIILSGLLLSFNNCSGQQKIKPDLYILFEENPSKGMHKYTFEQSEVIKKNKKYIPKTIYDVYGYQLGESREKDRYKFTTINRDNYCMRDSNFVRKNAKQFKSVKDIKGFFYDSTDYKRFPFKRVFIVEYIDVNRYKVVQVNTYIGSDQ